MTLLQLYYFQKLAHVLKYTQTAQELHISQPSLSYAISELEKEMGVLLFRRVNRKIELTVYGRAFLPYVNQVLSLLEQGCDRLKQLSGSKQIVRLGYFHSVSASFVPNLVESFYKYDRDHNIQFRFVEGPSYDIFCQLQNGELDLAFCLHRADWAEAVPILQQSLYLAVPKGHILSKRSSAAADDFLKEPMIMLEQASSLRSQMDHICERHGIVPKVVFEVKECNAALQYVGLKFGVAVLPKVPATESERVVLIPIVDKENEFVRTIYLSWDKSKALSAAAESVRDFILKSCNK